MDCFPPCSWANWRHPCQRDPLNRWLRLFAFWNVTVDFLQISSNQSASLIIDSVWMWPSGSYDIIRFSRMTTTVICIILGCDSLPPSKVGTIFWLSVWASSCEKIRSTVLTHIHQISSGSWFPGSCHSIPRSDVQLRLFTSRDVMVYFLQSFDDPTIVSPNFVFLGISHWEGGW